MTATIRTERAGLSALALSNGAQPKHWPSPRYAGMDPIGVTCLSSPITWYSLNRSAGLVD